MIKFRNVITGSNIEIEFLNEMNIHLISDDFFFSLGCEAILRENGYQLNRISSDKIGQRSLAEQINKGDVCLVAMGSYLTSKIVLEKISYQQAKVMLFVEIQDKNDTMCSMHVFLSKKISINLLISCFENLFLYFENTKKPLTRREMEVMINILQGKSFAEVSVTLNISVKTVYAHRRNLFNKIGFRNSHAIYFLIYQSLIDCIKSANC